MSTLANIKYRLLKALPVICLFDAAGNGVLEHVPSDACGASVPDVQHKPHPTSTIKEIERNAAAICEIGLEHGRVGREACARLEAHTEAIRQQIGLPPFDP